MPVPLTAQQTLDRARTVMQSGRGAALPELLSIIETLSLNICEVTVTELAELIEKDAVVLAKIISVANTLAHNPGVAPLTTLSQAIHQLGYNRIRSIAVSLMLLDSAGESNPPEQREAAAYALCAGLLAQSTAESLGTHDPEFAFACTTLRNFGRIILAAVSAEHYRAAALVAPKVGEPAAYRSMFGVTPTQFTHQLLSAAKLPAEVLRTMRDAEPESIKGAVATTHDARLFGIVDFGSRLATLALETHGGPDVFVREMRVLARRFENLVPGAVDVAKPALQRTDERLRNFTRCSGARTLPPKSLARISQRLRQLSPNEAPPEPAASTFFPEPLLPAASAETPAPSAPPRAASPAPTPPPLPEPVTTPEPAPTAWDDPLASSAAFESLAMETPPEDPLLQALALVRIELGAQECWYFRGTKGWPGLGFVNGLGHAFTKLPAGGRLQPEERSVFGICLQRQEVVLIHDTSDATIVPYLPLWFRQTAGAPLSFCLIPLRSAGSPEAVLLVGWGTPRRIALTPAQISSARRLLTSLPAVSPATAR